jgi:uncharacterized membrane protein YdbT with pleckstrin-like domain
MSYIEQNIMKDEQIIYKTKMSNVVYATPLGCFIFGVVFMIVKLFFRDYPEIGNLFIFFSLILWVLGFGALISAIISVKTSEIGVTNKRVIIKIGVFSKRSLEMLLEKIESLQVEQNLIEQMFNSGTVNIKGSGGTVTPFSSISNPFEFRKKVQEQIESIKK